MRIELVVDVPGIVNPDAVDAIRLGNEVVRLVRNDLGSIHAELIHVAVGNDIPVPGDFTDDAPLSSIEPTDIVHDPSASSPYVHPFVEHVTSPYAVEEPVQDGPSEELKAIDPRLDHDAALADAYPED